MNRVWIHVELSLIRNLYHLGNEQSLTRDFYSVMLDCLLIGRSIAGHVPRQLPPLAHYYLRYDKHCLCWPHVCNQEWYKCCLGNKVQQWVAGTMLAVFSLSVAFLISISDLMSLAMVHPCLQCFGYTFNFIWSICSCSLNAYIPIKHFTGRLRYRTLNWFIATECFDCTHSS